MNLASSDRRRSVAGGQPACGLELLLDHAALVVADPKTLFEIGDRVGRAAAQAQRVAEVVEEIGRASCRERV